MLKKKRKQPPLKLKSMLCRHLARYPFGGRCAPKVILDIAGFMWEANQPDNLHPGDQRGNHFSDFSLSGGCVPIFWYIFYKYYIKSCDV